MDQQDRQQNPGATSSANDPVIPPATVPQTSQQVEPCTAGNPQGRGNGKTRRTPKERWRELWAAGLDRHIELFLTLAITLFACVQLIVSCSNNSSTSRQTERLLDSANRIDDAADSFSTSSANIDRAMQDAVTQLDAQAKQIEASRKSSEAASQKALQATIDNFHQDQRAWVGIDNWLLTKFAIGSPVVVKVRFMNRGRTPAFNVMGGGTGGRIVSNDHTPAQVEDILGEEFGKIVLKPQAPISPQNGLELIGTEQIPLDEGRFNAVSSGISTWYTVGKITYKDAFQHDQWVTYCLRMEFSEKTPYLVYCEKDNDMSGSLKQASP